MQQTAKYYLEQEAQEEEEEQDEFRLPGEWLEGDSLAPPCQSDYGIMDALVDLAQISDKDVRK